MQFLALTLAALPVAFAQYGGGGSDSTTTSAAAASTTSSAASADGVHIVQVGNGGLTFSPSNLTAKVGEKVEFQFYPPTHSVAQASFASPCTPLANDTGFFSGGFKTTSGVNSETFTITINDTKPIWYYCGFPTHCESGMVGVINAPADGSKTLEQFVAAAAKVNSTVAPSTVQGGVKGSASNGTSAGTSTSTATTSSASASSTGNAGVETRGSVQWGLFAITGLVAAGVGSLIV